MAEEEMTSRSDEVAEFLTSDNIRNIWIPLKIAKIV